MRSLQMATEILPAEDGEAEGCVQCQQGSQQRFVSAGDAHGGRFPTGKHEGVQVLGDVVGTTALHDVNGKTEFVSSSAKRFRMLVAGPLKHRQTHTEHVAGSMPFPISPTLQPRRWAGL